MYTSTLTHTCTCWRVYGTPSRQPLYMLVWVVVLPNFIAEHYLCACVVSRFVDDFGQHIYSDIL